jgi:hypothetical protein
MFGTLTPFRRVACAATLTLLGFGLAGTAASAAPTTYRTYFQDPGPNGVQDLSLENHAIALIDATPPGAQITFAFRDFNRATVADALIAAHQRGVLVDGVIDGGERNRAVVRNLVAAIGASRVVICGTPLFVFNSCISDALVGGESLQHNKFLTFSALSDGRDHVVLQTSKNFLSPSQLTYYNDMVEIAGDVPLYDTYVGYLFDLKAQVRTSDYDRVGPRDGDNTAFIAPRAQPDPDTEDTIVEQMDEIDCAGAGRIRVAQLAFRSERAAIMRKLIELRRAGCDIDIIVSNADGDIIAGLAAAGVPVHPYILQSAAPRPQVLVHDKFWLVDARNTRLGTRARITYAGTSNWRFDEQKSDDLLLRIRNDDVFTEYSQYWATIRSRVDGDDPPWVPAAADTVAPDSALQADPAPDQAGWNTSAVTVRVAGSDGHAAPAAFSGLKALSVEMSGADSGQCRPTATNRTLAVRECRVAADGSTTIAYSAEDVGGNVVEKSHVVRVDQTPPEVTCSVSPSTLWPPNHRLVTVDADVTVTDATSGPAAFELVAVSSSEPDDGPGDGDVAGDISGWVTGADDASGQLRAERSGAGRGRVYTLEFAGHDRAGNETTCTGTVRVPHDMRR